MDDKTFSQEIEIAQYNNLTEEYRHTSSGAQNVINIFWYAISR